jgi:uncharacterized protein
MSLFEKESVIPASAQTVFDFHKRPDALQLLIPPGQPIHVVEHTGGIENGARVVIEMGFRPFAIRWVARHQGYIEGVQFQDVQERGPFRSWVHTHTVRALTPHSCVLRDHIEYELGLDWILGAIVRRKLEQTFAYRHGVTALRTTRIKI